MTNSILSPDTTYLELSDPGKFKRFYQGFIEILKRHLKRNKIGDSDQYFYTCGEIHDWSNKSWEPFFHLWSFTETKQLDFYVVKDLIEENLGRQFECECEILGDKLEIGLRGVSGGRAKVSGGRAKLSRCIFKVLIPNIGVLGTYFALFRPKKSDIGILHFFKLKRFSRFKDLSSQCHATH